MLKTINGKLAFLVIFSFAFLAGCSGSKDGGKAKADLSAASDILQYVPADSPYVIANLAPTNSSRRLIKFWEVTKPLCRKCW